MLMTGDSFSFLFIPKGCIKGIPLWLVSQAPNAQSKRMKQSSTARTRLEKKNEFDLALQKDEKWLSENPPRAEVNSDVEQFPSRPEPTAHFSLPSSANSSNSATDFSNFYYDNSGQFTLQGGGGREGFVQ